MELRSSSLNWTMISSERLGSPARTKATTSKKRSPKGAVMPIIRVALMMTAMALYSRTAIVKLDGR